MRSHSFYLAVAVFATMIALGSASATCTNATLKGSYGSLEFGGNGQYGVTLTHYLADGNGNLTGSLTTSVNGVISTNTFTGIYSVSKDCTGTFTLTYPNKTTASFNFAIDGAKKYFELIQTDSGWVNGGYAIAQGAVPCGLTGKKQTFATNIGGSGTGGIGVSSVGLVTLNGAGTFSGTTTLSENGVISEKVPVSGSYTAKSDCTGTAQITLSGFPTSSYNAVEVGGGKEIMLIETDNNTIVTGTLLSQ